jgi:hypothetical protein
MVPCKKCWVSRAIHCSSLRVPSKGDLPPCSPHRAPIDGNTLFTERTFTVPGKGTPPLPKGPLWRERPISRAIFFISLGFPNKRGLLIKYLLSLKVPSVGASPPLSLNGAPMERDVPLPEAVVYSFSHISQEFPVKELSHQTGVQHTVADHGAPRGRRPTYSGVQPGSPRGSFTTLLLLPQCHAACSTILDDLCLPPWLG